MKNYLNFETEITDLEKLMSKVVDKRTVPMEEDKWFNFEGERVSKSNIDYNQLPVRA